MIGFAGYVHLVLFCLVLPWAAVRRARVMASLPYPPRKKLFYSVLIQHSIFIVYTLLTARFEGIDLFTLPHGAVKSLLMAGGFLVVFIGLMIPQWKRNVLRRERLVYLFMPRGPGEKSLWILISAAAGFGEEIIYRGVIWVLLFRLTGSLWQSALIAALAFAIGHLYQGWKSTDVIFFFGLAVHALVWLTGSLIPVMIVHFVYDLTAGMAYSYFGEKYGYPFEGIAVNAGQSELQSIGAP